MIDSGREAEVPAEVLSSPSLLFLYYRIEQILGIRAGSQALINLNDYLEKTCGASFTENPAAYEHLLTSREQIFEISKLITINETYFFREGAHFNLLVSLLPQFIKQNRVIEICSAATSTGCEAYSIAMLLDNYINNKQLFDYQIDAFDVSAQAIETAKNGRYTANTLRNDGSAWNFIFDSYLIKENNEYIVTQNIRNKVRFFPHNIMRGFEKQYDIIFFRNALIYFTPHNRLITINNLAQALFDNGLLFIGMSETSSVQHPLLVSRNSTEEETSPDGAYGVTPGAGSGVFYFQKTACHEQYLDKRFTDQAGTNESWKNNISPNSKDDAVTAKPVQETVSFSYRQKELPVSISEISAILDTEEGGVNAKKVQDMLACGKAKTLNCSELAASIVFFLNKQDYNSVSLILPYLENCNSQAFTRFLQGEYNFLMGNADEAEKYFHEAAARDKIFWPAFYRIASLAADGNRTRYEYKIKKAIESIELSQNQNGGGIKYECFMGGFSPDYFRRILEKKLLPEGEF